MSATALSEPILEPDVRDSVIDRAERLDALMRPRSRQAERPGHELEARRETRRLWYRDVEDGVLDIANLLPAGTEDYEARKLLEALTELRRGIDDDPDVTDAAGRVSLACAQMIDVLGRMRRALEHTELEDPQHAGRYLFARLGTLPAPELAELFAVSTKTIGTWRRGGPIRTHPRRVQLIAQLSTYLLPAMTPTGVSMWLRTSAEALGDRTPLQLIGGAEPSPEAWSRLVGFARGARGQLAS